jgi:hypothetical protein
MTAGLNDGFREKDTMELHPIIKTLPPEVAFALGRVVTAHENRAHSRQKVKEADARLEAAKREHGSLGMYEDCGSFYQTQLDEATGSREACIARRVSMEKFYKKVKSEFLDAFPDSREALEALIPDALAHVDD